MRGRALIKYLSGDLARDDYRLRFEATDAMARALTCNPADLPGKLDKLTGQLKDAKRELSLARKELMPLMADELASGAIAIGRHKVESPWPSGPRRPSVGRWRRWWPIGLVVCRCCRSRVVWSWPRRRTLISTPVILPGTGRAHPPKRRRQQTAGPARGAGDRRSRTVSCHSRGVAGRCVAFSSRACALLALLILAPASSAQRKDKLDLLHADETEFIFSRIQDTTIVVGGVIFETESGMIYCDFCYLDEGPDGGSPGTGCCRRYRFSDNLYSAQYDLVSGQAITRGDYVELWSRKDSLFAVGTHAFYDKRRDYFEIRRIGPRSTSTILIPPA